MKIGISALVLFPLFFSFAVQSMEHKTVQKIDGEEFSFITKLRKIASLQELCIPALAQHCVQRVKNDPMYDKEQFKEFLTNNIHLLSDSFLPLMQEEIDHDEWKECTTISNEYGISLFHLSGNKFIWSEKKRGDFEDIYFSDATENKSMRLGCYPINNSEFILSLSHWGVVSPVRLYFRALKGDTAGREFFPSQYVFTTLASDTLKLEFAAGTSEGDIFIITDLVQKKPLKILSVHTASICALSYTQDSKLFSCDVEGNIFLWDQQSKNEETITYEPKQLPLQARISSIVSSADNSLRAFQHADDQYSASILDWNTLSITQHTYGKIIALTDSRKIVAWNDGYLYTYSLAGHLLKKIALPETAVIYGNKMPLFEGFSPVYIMTTQKNGTKTVSDFRNEGSPCGGHAIWVQQGTKKEATIETTFWIPQRFDADELFERLAKK